MPDQAVFCLQSFSFFSSIERSRLSLPPKSPSFSSFSSSSFPPPILNLLSPHPITHLFSHLSFPPICLLLLITFFCHILSSPRGCVASSDLIFSRFSLSHRFLVWLTLPSNSKNFNFTQQKPQHVFLQRRRRRWRRLPA